VNSVSVHLFNHIQVLYLELIASSISLSKILGRSKAMYGTFLLTTRTCQSPAARNTVGKVGKTRHFAQSRRIAAYSIETT
jgi:hypothetical protein